MTEIGALGYIAGAGGVLAALWALGDLSLRFNWERHNQVGWGNLSLHLTFKMKRKMQFAIYCSVRVDPPAP